MLYVNLLPGVQDTNGLLQDLTSDLAARQFNLMELQRMPKAEAAIMARAEVFPASVSNVDLTDALMMAIYKEQLHLLPPVTRKQQCLQRSMVSEALSTGMPPVQVKHPAPARMQACKNPSRLYMGRE